MRGITQEALALAHEVVRDYARPLHADDRRWAIGLVVGCQRLAANIEPANAVEAAPEFRALVARIGRPAERVAS